jgi:hypothetical protein
VSRRATDPVMAGIREHPSCGHQMLVECPLTARDWEEVFFALIAFRGVCRSVSERAHKRAAAPHMALEIQRVVCVGCVDPA